MRKFVVLAGTVLAVVLCSGGALAATHYLITSTNQIKPSVLKQLRDTLGKPVKLTAKTVKAALTTVYPETTIGEPGQSTANCPTGTVVVGGGWEQGPIPVGPNNVDDSEPSGNGWFVQMDNLGSEPGIFRAVAVCATRG